MNFLNAINEYRCGRWCYTHHLKPLAVLFRMFTYLFHNSYVPYTAEIGKGTLLGYKGIGVIIHSNSKIGENCIIGSNVTLGGGNGPSKNKIAMFNEIRRNVPVVGDRVYLATGAKIIGDVVIGNDAIIGANAVVRCDIPPGTVWGGVPAKFLRTLRPEEYKR